MIKDAPRNLSPERLALLMGSCFSDNMGRKMLSCGWPAIVNPCGTVYNPVSMAVLFQLAMTHRALRREIILSGITQREGKFVSWLMGSKANGDTPDETADRVCEAIDELERGIEQAEVMILTFGTSDVWLLKDTDRAVGNCHKHTASEFDRKRAGVDEIADTWTALIGMVRERNPEIKVILTISPRRYLNDSFRENTLQKAVLALACDKICKSAGAFYFPAYEIMNDDLRDYRFYGKDLLHPSEMAVDYIWEKFTESYLDKPGLERLAAMEKEARRIAHRSITDR